MISSIQEEASEFYPLECAPKYGEFSTSMISEALFKKNPELHHRKIK
jgi:hypothetical protein